jgi:3-dehydroquinate synthase class II
VCLDLIQNLKEGEGLLVGSSAKLLSLVHAETLETGYVPPRLIPHHTHCIAAARA